MVPPRIYRRLLRFFGPEAKNGLGRIVTTRYVARFGGQVAGLEVSVIIWRHPLLQGECEFRALGIIVGALAVQAFVVGIESIAEPIECAEERAGLVPVPTAAVFGERTDTQWTRIEKPQVFLLRKLLR